MFAKNNGLAFLEVSAKTAYNVDEVLPLKCRSLRRMPS